MEQKLLELVKHTATLFCCAVLFPLHIALLISNRITPEYFSGIMGFGIVFWATIHLSITIIQHIPQIVAALKKL